MLHARMDNTWLSRRLARIGLLALPVLTAWFFAPQLANAFDIKHHILYLGALALMVLWAGKPDAFSLPKGLIGGSLLVWVLGVSISAAHAENSYLALRMFLEVVALLLLAAALFNLRDLEAAQRRLEDGIIIAGAGVAAFALKQYFLPDFLDPGFSALGKLKIYSTLGNSNLAALVILAAVPSAAWRILRGSAISRASYAAATLLLLGGLIATQARHALIAVGVMAVVAALWLGSRQMRRGVLAILLIGACLGAAMLVFADLPPSVTHSLKGRWFIWLTSLQMLREHPLAGVGLGHYGLSHMGYQGAMFASGRFNACFDNASVISEGHNDFLNWGAMTGMFGLLGFTMLCAGALWKGWHSPSLKQGAPQLYLALAGYISAMFFIAVTSYTAPALFFWLLLGMVLARSDLAKVRWAPRTWSRHAAAVCLAALLAVDVPLAWQEVRGTWHEAQGDKLMEQHDLWLAGKEYREALLWNPHDGRPRKKYATALFLSGNLDEALAELETAKRDSGDLGIYLLEGEIRTRSGDLGRAELVYRQILASFPNMVGPHFILGQIYQLQGRRGEANAEFRKVLDIRPSPFNLNMTVEKVELQKRIVRDYLQEGAANSPPGSSPAGLPEPSESPD